MKRLLLITAISVCYLAASHSQISLTHKNHALQIGDDHHFIITNNVEPGPGGADQYWDFSDLEYSKDLISHMLPPSNFNRAGEIPRANTVIQEFDNKFLFKVKGNIIEQYGIISCGNTIIKYDDPFVKMIYPFTYRDFHEGDFSGAIENGNNTTILKGYYSLEADAYGTLVLPGDVEVKNVLRLKTVKRRTYGNCGDVTSTTYRWYCESVRYPLLTIIKQESNEKESVVRTAYYADIKQAMEKSRDIEERKLMLSGKVNVNMKVFPNPYDDVINISYKLSDDSNVEIRILDNTGKVVFQEDLGIQQAGNNIFSLNTDQEGMAAGVYHLKLIANTTVLTEKIVPIK